MSSWLELQDSFLCDREFKNSSPKTIDDYRQFLRVFFDWTDSTPETVTPQTVRDFYFHLRDDKPMFVSRLSDVTIATYLRHLKVFLNFAVKLEAVPEKVADFDIPKQKKRQIQILTKEELKEIISVYDDTNLMLAIVLFCHFSLS